MKLITKRNFFPILCMTYTIISISLTIFEIIMKQEMNPTQLNIFLFLLFSVLGVGVLSQQDRFDAVSPLTMLFLQYAFAIFILLGSLWIASFFVEIHPNGYRDMTVSFSVPYLIGAVIYTICLKLEVKKQNERLRQIKKYRPQFDAGNDEI